MASDHKEIMPVPVDEPSCRICWSSDEPFDMIQPCKCEGTAAHVHTKCLEDWLKVNASENCVACRSRYHLPRRVEYRRAFTKLIRGFRWMMATTFAIFLLTSIGTFTLQIYLINQ